jgi:hypothetical protein
VKLLVARYPTVYRRKVQNVMAVTEVAAGSSKTYWERDSCEVSMKRKLLLAVVWIALAGGIAALFFPPDSVLTAQFRH